jgi:hypothetical protein
MFILENDKQCACYQNFSHSNLFLSIISID